MPKATFIELGIYIDIVEIGKITLEYRDSGWIGFLKKKRSILYLRITFAYAVRMIILEFSFVNM